MITFHACGQKIYVCKTREYHSPSFMSCPIRHCPKCGLPLISGDLTPLSYERREANTLDNKVVAK